MASSIVAVAAICDSEPTRSQTVKPSCATRCPLSNASTTHRNASAKGSAKMKRAQLAAATPTFDVRPRCMALRAVCAAAAATVNSAQA